MSCLPGTDPLCEVDTLVQGLTGWNWNSVAETSLGVLFGAILTFVLGLIEWRRQRGAENKRAALAEQRSDARERDRRDLERDIRNREAAVLVAEFISPDRVKQWVHEGRLAHLQVYHPERVQVEFPDPTPVSGLFEAKLALARPIMMSTGAMHELIRALRFELNTPEYGRDARLLSCAFNAFTPVAMVYLEDPSRGINLNDFHTRIDRSRRNLAMFCPQCGHPV